MKSLAAIFFPHLAPATPRPVPSPLAVALCILSFLLFADPAFAQTVAAASSSIHLDPAIQSEIANLVGAIIVAIGLAVWKWLDAHSPLKNAQAEDLARSAFMGLLDKGAQFGVTQTQALETKVGDVDVGNPTIAAAANFAISHGPALAKAMGVDVTTAAGQAAIVRSVTARIGGLADKAGGDASARGLLTLPAAVAAPAAPTAAPAIGSKLGVGHGPD